MIRNWLVMIGLPGLLIAMCMAQIGCTPGVQWRAFSMDYAQSDTQRGEKLQFVYLRHWAVPACTQFEENVLKSATVRSATADLYSVVLDFRVDRKIADSWRISEPPAVVILDPRGRVLEKASGTLSAEAVVAMIQRAKKGGQPPPERTPNSPPPKQPTRSGPR